MTTTRKRRSGWALAVLMVTGSLAVSASPLAVSAPQVRSTEELSRKLGLQQVPKTDTIDAKASGPAKANPMMALLPDPSQANMHAWQKKIEQQSRARAAAVERRKKAAGTAVAPLRVNEREPAAVRGQNDTAGTAQRIRAFGSGRGKRPAARIVGAHAAAPAPTTFAPSAEDDGSITLAKSSGVRTGQQTRTTGRIGDGPHGRAGTGNGDLDFYTVRGAAKQRLRVDIDTPNSDLDTIVVLWDAQGNFIDGIDGGPDGSDSLLNTALPRAGTYYVLVTGFAALPNDPFDPASGTGAGSEGNYTVTFGLDVNDADFYAVNLRAGDVLSGSAAGASTRLTVYDSTRRERFGSSVDASFAFPLVSPLTGGGNAVVDHVVGRSGRYYVAVEGVGGRYETTLEVYRSGPETRNVTQTIFLDFNGARVNTGIWGGPGVRQLSPLSAFLSRWGLKRSQQNALINQVVATVAENLRRDFRGTGVRVKILNSRDHKDPFGKPNVSRLIVGGTIPEAGVETIGIAQSIDPGNFDTAETALILLDVVSQPAGKDRPFSLNTYLTPKSNRVKFVGTALGNIAAHEAGHYLGSWHVDAFNDVLNLMDQGGNFPGLFGVGRDGVGGTADDPDVDFGRDALAANEGRSGLENTRTRTRWALTR